MASGRKIDTRNLLYHYLQRDLHDVDPELFRVLAAGLVSRLGVWLSPEIYQRLPLLVPYARRDPYSRGDRAAGIPDQWGSPDREGYFRDDNSLVKGVPRSLTVASSFRLYRARRVGTGFVAAHLWRKTSSQEAAARNPLTYSFVPNLVWLPKEVAGMSDLEGSFVQRYLQRVSLTVYRDAPVLSEHRGLSERIWRLLPAPVTDGELAVPPREMLSFFTPDEAFFLRRAGIIRGVAAALSDGRPTRKVVSTRYTEGIPSVADETREHLAQFLRAYADAVAA